MRIYLQLIALWVVVALGAGVLGRVWVDRVWRAEEERAFQQDVSAAVAVVCSRQWDPPAEAQPSWEEMEQDLGLGIVPLAEAVTAGQGMRWYAAGKRRERVTTIVDLEDRQALSGSKQLQITRDLEVSPMVGLWWAMWAVLNSAALVVGTLAFLIVRSDISSKRRLLRPWFQALEREEPKAALLPNVEAQDSDFCLQMDAVAESINRVYQELQNANERSELVLGNLREGVLAVDDRYRVLLANKALRRVLELPNESFLYRPFLEIIRTPVIAKAVRSILRTQAVVDEQFEFGPDPKHLRIIGRAIPLGEGRNGALLTVRDETMIKRVDMIKKDFVANASHELKTPLAAIRAYAETLQMGALDDRKAADSFVKSIVSQADRLDGLVKGMLQLSRVEVGSALNYERFDAVLAIEPCLNAAHALAASQGVSLNVDAPEEAFLWSDRDGFQTIVSNLLSNAVRYTDEGGEVHVALAIDESWLTLEVRDTGIGIPDEDLERIFERFYRAEKDRSVKTGGTGLGLSIVKHLVNVLGGRVLATSRVGQGSCFVVELPVSEVAETP